MQTLKEQLPDESVLEKSVDEVLETKLPNFLEATHIRREELVSSRRFAAVSFSFSIAIVMALYFLFDSYNTIFGKAVIAVAMAWAVLMFIAGRRWLMNERLLAKEMNMALVPLLGHLFNRAFMYTHNEMHAQETKQLLRESKLITQDKLTITSDDMYHVYADNDVSFRELLVTRRVKRGKSETTETVFKGMFVVANLPKRHDAATYISTEGDKSGFAHRTFWRDVFEFGPIQETELEWNDFEEDLHVASNDPIKAREILTPDFMQDLHGWWSEHKLNIRIAFVGEHMFMLLPEASIKIGTSTTSTKPARIKSFMMTLARPIWRSLLLIEDIPR